MNNIFKNQSKIKKINLGNGVPIKNIDSAFENCRYLTSVFCNKNRLKEVKSAKNTIKNSNLLINTEFIHMGINQLKNRYQKNDILKQIANQCFNIIDNQKINNKQYQVLQKKLKMIDNEKYIDSNGYILSSEDIKNTLKNIDEIENPTENQKHIMKDKTYFENILNNTLENSSDIFDIPYLDESEIMIFPEKNKVFYNFKKFKKQGCTAASC